MKLTNKKNVRTKVSRSSSTKVVTAKKSKATQPRDANGRFMSFNKATPKKSTNKGEKSKNNTSLSSTRVSKTNTKAKISNKKESTNTPTKGQSKTSKITIHNVHLLDASSSMSGGKYTNAINGINAELLKLKSSKDKKIIFTQTIYEFCGTGWGTGSLKLYSHCERTPIKLCNTITGIGVNGNTPLNEAIGTVLENQLKYIKSGDKVIMTIFTDGEENASHGKYDGSYIGRKNLSDLIKKCEGRGFTITFMGTEKDTANVIKDLGIDKSNTITHKNTSVSITSTYAARSVSMDSYSSNVKSGKSVTKGFFQTDKIK